jgi:nicotinamide-nucleotide amidase
VEAEIITIGSELLEPGRTDTNSAYLTAKLASVGIPVVFHAKVGDDRTQIAEVVRHALARSDLVLATGGLGPTSDDVTREGFADAMGLDLQLDENVLDQIHRRFTSRGYRMPDVNRRQAMVPHGARVLPNRDGTAPGLWIPWTSSVQEHKDVILLPGPPREVCSIFEEHVLPHLAGRRGEWIFRGKRMFVTGLTESAVEEKIGEFYRELDNPRTTILSSAGQIEINMTAKGRDAAEADGSIETLLGRFRGALGRHIFSESGETLEQVVGHLLKEAGTTLAVAESCTGGLIAHRLTEVAGSSAYFEQGFITYSNQSKVDLLGVPPELIREHGAVSEPVARAMARGARKRAGVDIAIAVTGIAGPGGGSPEKPVGLVFVAVSDTVGEKVERYQLPQGRSRIKRWTSQLALNLLRLRLMKQSKENQRKDAKTQNKQGLM